MFQNKPESAPTRDQKNLYDWWRKLFPFCFLRRANTIRFAALSRSFLLTGREATRMRRRFASASFIMPTFAQLSVGVLISFSFFIQTFAQNSAHEADRTVRPVVTASASQDLIRFTAPGKVTHMRLEIYSSLGVRILDTEIKGGNVLDWILEDSDGQRLSSGCNGEESVRQIDSTSWFGID